ncbi:hypothetical protein ACFFU1_00905 [Algibacter miyuki]|uniref:Por secretion system C-terminal sorting domain-containing protein n=1 Tax=Algibacter miyuki TaxID=1306933 RepID=A0ABV5GUY6_9FLAO|nr:hypothetical protein [Algibacter miyuki]MDN3664770.1 hypothetical protein [Algibacter miyuki]
MKKAIVFFSLVFIFSFGFSQTKIAKLTFETDPTDTDPAITDISYTTSEPEFFDYSDASRPEYFFRSTNNIPDVTFSKTNDLGDYFFAVQNATNGNTSIATLYLEQINIEGYENLELRVYLAERVNTTPRGWDNNIGGNNDYVHFDYDINSSGTFNPCLWIESSGVFPNEDNAIARIDTDFDETGDGSTIGNTFNQFISPITGTGNTLDMVIDFKLNNDDEDIAIDNIEIWGTLIPSCSNTSIWNGTTWSNGIPDITTIATINGPYTTNTSNGSFSACSLTVNDDLIIEDGYYVEVENNITVTGNLILKNNGTLVQNNDSATFSNSGGTTSFTRSTHPLNNWYDYTYWSSPIKNLTIAASPLKHTNRRYWFDANNYLDQYTEINNTDTFEVIQASDDIDDNGDDWQYATDTTIMTPGVGFAAMHYISGYTGVQPYDYEFIGEFNNGIITTPISHNPLNTGGHWNLIGNPYPSALDFDAFVTNNPGVIEGAAYLWSHSTPISETTSGNESLNFSQNDYVIMTTGSGSVNNSPGTLLEYIPSGQSFFIAGTSNGIVTFNNSMRIKNGASNSQFFKNSNAKNNNVVQPDSNKLWINLTSDNGIFNQVLIAYVNGATDNYDGMVYDAPRNLSSGVASIIYTLIEDKNDKKFAIQGKSPSSITEEEIITLGFLTSIESATTYTLSIEKIEGEFLTGRNVYLKDNLLNTFHDLSVSEYNFTSETGEFNNRFEIVFNNQTSLSANTHTTVDDNTIKIVHLGNKQFSFTTSNGLTINHIDLFDLYGRKIYRFNEISETYSFQLLNNAPYIAKITLSDNSIKTRKIVIH